MLVLNSGVHSSSKEEQISEASMRRTFIVNYLKTNTNLHSLPNSQKTWLASIRKSIRRMLSGQNYGFLISNFRRVLNLNVCILLGISPASD